jgi:hypothetical protein
MPPQCAAVPAGVAEARLGRPCEDTITLTTQWQGLGEGGSSCLGTAVYTASWIAPKVGASDGRHRLGGAGVAGGRWGDCHGAPAEC